MFESPHVLPLTNGPIHLEGSIDRGQVEEHLHFDETGGTFTHEIKADVEPVLDYVKDQHSMYGKQAGKNKEGDFYHAARVPTVVIQAWLNVRGLTMADFKGEVIDRFLNDSENAAFRIWQGRV